MINQQTSEYNNQLDIKLMTYFAQQKRFIPQKPNNHQNIGPGSYAPQKQLTQLQSYAPFGSLLKKPPNIKNTLNQPLGPGSYNINRQIIKPSVIQYQNQNCIIIKINQQGGSQFKSKLLRFDSKIKNFTPGPGTYYHQFQNKLFKNKRTKSVGQAVNKMKQLYQLQYNNKRKPTLQSDLPNKVQQQAKPKDKVKSILRWSLNKEKRFQIQKKQICTDQDKSIILDKVNFQKKKLSKQLRQSSFFASKSVKSCFDQIIYKSNNPFKVQIRKMLGFEDHSPGPGTYHTGERSNDKKPLKFQFFGSTVQRFSNKSETQNIIGPGEYDQDDIKQTKQIQKLKKPHKQHRKVITQPSQRNTLGPGCYFTQKDTSSIHKSTYNRKISKGQGQFGSKIPRFNVLGQKKKQWKSQYISFMAQEDQQRKKKIQEEFNNRRNALKNRKNCVFISQTHRGIKQNPDNSFGMYQIQNDDIGWKIKKQQELYQQFIQCNLQKPGFLSSVQRFKNQKIQQPSHKDCWCQIKQVQKKNIQHLSPSFQSNCKRTEVFQGKNKGPSVGLYSMKTSFIRQSFNSKFIKQNKNKTKKIKMWNNQTSQQKQHQHQQQPQH